MSLENVVFQPAHDVLPQNVRAFLLQAEKQICEFTLSRQLHVRGFISCSFEVAYLALRQITAARLTNGKMFCEWGSGFGVTAALAAMMGFEAYGIEIDTDLCDASHRLARQFDIPVRFVAGSFIPEGSFQMIADARGKIGGDLTLIAESDQAYEKLGKEIKEFDLIFAYPWPNDKNLTETIFDSYASRGSLLLTYNGSGTVQLQRKV